MEDKAIRGIPWTILTYAGPKVLGVITTIALARLLVPADFGLFALAFVVVGLIGLFRDLGLGATLVLGVRLDERAKGTVLTLMLATAAASMLLIAAVSPVAASAFDQPGLPALLIVLTLAMPLNALAWFHSAVLQRELDFRRRFTAGALQAATNSAFALVLAALGYGVWSLVLAHIAASAVSCVVTMLLAPERVRPRFEPRSARDALRAGQGFLVQGGFAFVAQNADYVAVGRMLGETQLGYYTLAYRLAELPYLGIADPVANVTFPAFARMRDRGEDVSDSFLQTLRLVALVTCPLGLLLSGAADPFVSLFLGDQWSPMIGSLAVMGIWAAVRTVQVTVAWLLNSIGQAAIVGATAALSLVWLIPALFLAADRGGITGVAWVMLANLSLSFVILSVLAARRAHVSIGRQWAAVRPVAFACPGTWLACWTAAQVTSGSPPVLGLTAAVASGAAAYVLTLSIIEPGLLRHSLAQMGRLLRRPSAPVGETAG